MKKAQLIKMHSDLNELEHTLRAQGFEEDAQAALDLQESVETLVKRLPQEEAPKGPLMDFQIRSLTMEQTLRELGHILAMIVPPGIGYTLLLYEYGQGGGLFYISTAQRADTIATMKEFIRKQEEKEGPRSPASGE